MPYLARRALNTMMQRRTRKARPRLINSMANMRNRNKSRRFGGFGDVDVSLIDNVINSRGKLESVKKYIPVNKVGAWSKLVNTQTALESVINSGDPNTMESYSDEMNLHVKMVSSFFNKYNYVPWWMRLFGGATAAS